VSFVDDCTRYRVIYLLQKKSEVFAAFKLYKAFAEKQTGFSIKALRDDKGGEYMGKEMDNFLKEHGIMREHTTTATPQQNGVAERSNRIFDEGITSMLNEASLPGSFWGDALGAFVHVLNRSPSSSLDGITPYEAWFNHKPSVSHLRVFGCQAYVHVQKDKRKSFESKTRCGIFIGYPPDFKRLFRGMWSLMNKPCLEHNLVTQMVPTFLFTWPQCQSQGEITKPKIASLLWLIVTSSTLYPLTLVSLLLSTLSLLHLHLLLHLPHHLLDHPHLLALQPCAGLLD
jgi:hypothetical protein